MNDVAFPAAPKPEAIICPVCGLRAPYREPLSLVKNVSAKPDRCPACVAKRRRIYNRVRFVGMVVLLTFAPRNLLDEPDDIMHVLILGFAVFYLTIVLMVLPHEIAHALMARIVGFRPVAILVGEGTRIFDRRVLGVHVRIGSSPHGGYTYVELRECRGFNIRATLVFAAGGLLHLALGIATFIAARSLSAYFMSPVWDVVILAFGIANIVFAISTFWPRTITTPVGTQVTDGTLILQRLLKEPMPWEAHGFSIHHFQASLAYQEGDHSRAIREAELAQAATVEPDAHALCVALRAECLSESGAARAAVDLLAPWLVREDISEDLRAHVGQAYAWAVLLTADAERLEDAIQRVERCAQREPWVAVYVIKHACLLIAGAAVDSRRIPEARRLIDSLKEFSLEGESRAYARLARGLVAAAEGQLDVARAELAGARKAGVSAASLSLLERQLASA